MKQSPDNQINASFIDISRIKCVPSDSEKHLRVYVLTRLPAKLAKKQNADPWLKKK